ncbi:MAG: type II CRISPR-associated endonuclease Cas1 [Oscillospiraceae bacterium]|nr:type II CRISPR-associated endonuclease Cas1 [Oscillospiraceae bacterium]
MSWRTVVISNRCKLDLKLGYMVVRGEETKRVFLDEIALLIVENIAVSITGCLLSALIEKKVKVIFCDEKRNPSAELAPYYGSHDCSRKVKTQIGWCDELKGIIWTEIVAEKIRKQAEFLEHIGKRKEAEMLRGYLTEIEYRDITNREGHAAKVYFNSLFGMDFTRNLECPTNAALNYGYTLLLSAFNREITANGYLTQLGIFHDNMFNQFNLSSDLMEPFRCVIDRHVWKNEYQKFDKEEKYSMLSLLSEILMINNTNQTVLNTIKIYTRSVFDALNDSDSSLILFPHI